MMVANLGTGSCLKDVDDITLHGRGRPDTSIALRGWLRVSKYKICSVSRVSKNCWYMKLRSASDDNQ